MIYMFGTEDLLLILIVALFLFGQKIRSNELLKTQTNNMALEDGLAVMA